jgi:predicted lipase
LLLHLQLPLQQRTKYRLWIIGHSDGSSLAQLAALRAAHTLGLDTMGGVFLFGAQRVGSIAFAQHYNRLLGNQTLRWVISGTLNKR